jgi:hypothetical protein
VVATRAAAASAMMDRNLVFIPPFLLVVANGPSLVSDCRAVGTRPVTLW